MLTHWHDNVFAIERDSLGLAVIGLSVTLSNHTIETLRS